ncbi:MAG TPA: hypothetical protein VFQ91_00725 [Bryobacteraceae bacterium]|nr:hypothetical protein [Bryobacteraceae bacterium]
MNTKNNLEINAATNAVEANPTTVKNEASNDKNLSMKLTKEWTAAVGKTIKNVLLLADILRRAKDGLPHAAYKTWLLQNRMDEAKVSKFRSIGDCELFKKPEIQAQLPPNFTMLYQLSRIVRHEGFSVEIATDHFKTALTMLNTANDEGRFPTVEAMTSHINKLLGKVVAGPVQANSGEEVQNQKPVTENLTVIQPVPSSVENMDEDVDYGDENDIQIQITFQEAYKRMQVKRAILRLLHDNGIKSVEVVLRPKSVVLAEAA